MDDIDKRLEAIQGQEIDETLQFLQSLERAGTTSLNDGLVRPGERECPICKEKMAVENREGVSLDTCREHGVWLDFGELEEIISRIRRGEGVRRTLAMRRAVEDDRNRRGPGHVPG